MRVSKADGSQVLDLQRDALTTAGVADRNLYSDAASGKLDNRPGLESCLKALRPGDALVVWKLIGLVGASATSSTSYMS
jgi:DNA invertase Pin-like site-specific DNA recombinase